MKTDCTVNEIEQGDLVFKYANISAEFPAQNGDSE